MKINEKHMKELRECEKNRRRGRDKTFRTNGNDAFCCIGDRNSTGIYVVVKKGGRAMFTKIKKFIKDEGGMGVVEVILIIVVLISLVLIFKNQLTSIVKSLFSKISGSAAQF